MITFVVVGTESEQYKPTTFSWKQKIPHSYHCKHGLKSYEFEMKFSLSLWLILLPLYGHCRLAITIAPYPVICHFNGVSRFSHLMPILWYWGGYQFERAQFKSLALLNDPQWPFIVSPVVFFSEKTRANISTLPAARGGTEEPSSKSACLGVCNSEVREAWAGIQVLVIHIHIPGCGCKHSCKLVGKSSAICFSFIICSESSFYFAAKLWCFLPKAFSMNGNFSCLGRDSHFVLDPPPL